MQISIAYSSNSGEQSWSDLQVEEGANVEQAIQASGILARYPEINLETQKVGIFGKLVKLEQQLQEFDRIEIYRPIIADPKLVPRRKTADASEDD
ncbi:RnfH family protein [Marinospirillum alkaliphilum]|uniref:UPF0125 protein SAMN02745752_00006 n=1 Tax=Marinospirillum alkaliphilum DSM 21637 TaxID=1122209 RepID=A0A1K1TAP9_9GAMM|nr:RnfH family protein [Marinospirillum alkaliphilum]SFW97586.1 hypothetical protein SAMN02745752_00006 [Marinospirillum alkaliphilum DSM 21637]